MQIYMYHNVFRGAIISSYSGLYWSINNHLISTCYMQDIALALVGRWTEGRYSAKGLDTIPTLNRIFPCSSVSKESACNAGDPGSIHWLGRSPGEGNGNPLQYSCLENPMHRGAWQAIGHGVTRVRHDLVTKSPPPQLSICLQQEPDIWHEYIHEEVSNNETASCLIMTPKLMSLKSLLFIFHDHPYCSSTTSCSFVWTIFFRMLILILLV